MALSEDAPDVCALGDMADAGDAREAVLFTRRSAADAPRVLCSTRRWPRAARTLRAVREPPASAHVSFLVVVAYLDTRRRCGPRATTRSATA